MEPGRLNCINICPASVADDLFGLAGEGGRHWARLGKMPPAFPSLP
jgi:hypothetical protein